MFVLKKGVATRLPESPLFSFGLAWRNGTLYISAVNQLLAWSGRNGTTFTKHTVIYTAPKRFPGFNGLGFGFGANGRLYVGVDVGQKNDHGPATAPYQYDLLSFTTTGKNLRIVARGIRQPWQIVFPTGSSSPFVSDLSQDAPSKIANKSPDFVLRVRPGQNYGFPKCNWVHACRKYARPFKFFSSHTDIGGVGIIGGRLYMSEFGFVLHPKVVSMPLAGGPLQTVLRGFVTPIIGLGTHGGWVYVGELTGQVFRVRP